MVKSPPGQLQETASTEAFFSPACFRTYGGQRGRPTLPEGARAFCNSQFAFCKTFSGILYLAIFLYNVLRLMPSS